MTPNTIELIQADDVLMSHMRSSKNNDSVTIFISSNSAEPQLAHSRWQIGSKSLATEDHCGPIAATIRRRAARRSRGVNKMLRIAAVRKRTSGSGGTHAPAKEPASAVVTDTLGAGRRGVASGGPTRVIYIHIYIYIYINPKIQKLQNLQNLQKVQNTNYGTYTKY